MTKRGDDQHTCREIMKVGRRCDVGDRIVAYPQIEAQVSANTGGDGCESGIVSNAADYVVRDSANENTVANEWRPIRRFWSPRLFRLRC